MAPCSHRWGLDFSDRPQVKSEYQRKLTAVNNAICDTTVNLEYALVPLSASPPHPRKGKLWLTNVRVGQTLNGRTR